MFCVQRASFTASWFLDSCPQVEMSSVFTLKTSHCGFPCPDRASPANVLVNYRSARVWLSSGDHVFIVQQLDWDMTWDNMMIYYWKHLVLFKACATLLHTGIWAVCHVIQLSDCVAVLTHTGIRPPLSSHAKASPAQMKQKKKMLKCSLNDAVVTYLGGDQNKGHCSE